MNTQIKSEIFKLVNDLQNEINLKYDVNVLISVQGIERKPQVKRIVRTVAQITEVEYDAIMGFRRQMEVVKARHAAIYLLYKVYKVGSLTFIANHFDRDHSTIIHALKSVENQLETDKEYRRWFEDVKKNTIFKHHLK